MSQLNWKIQIVEYIYCMQLKEINRVICCTYGISPVNYFNFESDITTYIFVMKVICELIMWLTPIYINLLFLFFFFFYIYICNLGVQAELKETNCGIYMLHAIEGDKSRDMLHIWHLSYKLFWLHISTSIRTPLKKNFRLRLDGMI